jgi:outer membrane protein OmpA-like peptidoglycan-associated protein
MAKRSSRRTNTTGGPERLPSPAPANLLQRKCACGGPAGATGACAECEKTKRTVQRRSADEAEPTAVPPIVHEVVRSSGEPLDADTRASMESRLGHDFGDVHTDARAAESAGAVNALAYTVGQHIVFGEDQYRPGSTEGSRLIAHELTHTLQQSAGPTVPSQVSSPTDASEREADVVADAAAHPGPVVEGSARPSVLQRQPMPRGLDRAESPSPVLARAIGSVTIDAFETGHAEISASNRAKLQETARHIVTLLRRYPLSTIRVAGHADAVGQESNNQQLGQDRADAVRDGLTEMGVPVDRVITESKGESALLVKTQKAEPRNRRAEVMFEPEASPVGPLVPDLGKPRRETEKPPINFADFCKQSPELCLPPPEPGRNLPPDFYKPIPPAPKGTQKSVLDVVNEKLVDPVVTAVTAPLPEKVRKAALDLAHAGVEKGITSGLKAALGAAGVDPTAQQAIEKAVEAGIKEKGGRSSEGTPP